MVVRPSEVWIPYSMKKDIIAGSVLDLSGQGILDAPAGKYGWLKAVGNHFEFEGRPGVEQRFYGVNISNEVNYPSHEMADSLVARFARMGCNSIRVHHHDKLWENPENRERLDYFIAKAINAGIYITTDLYVSRKVKYLDLGIDKPGTMPMAAFKVLVMVSNTGFKNWSDFAGEFLCHVNPYTGRAYKDEPGMPLISLVNEGGRLDHMWKDKKQVEQLHRAWSKYGGQGELDPKSKEAHEFEEYLNETTYKKCSAFVRKLGCKALLTNDNHGNYHQKGSVADRLYDYVDGHKYANEIKPRNKGQKGVAEGYRHPVKDVYPWYLKQDRFWGGADAAKPYTFSEWRHCGPGTYRALGATMGAAYISAFGIDGLWPFAYAEGMKGLYEDDSLSPRRFAASTDGMLLGTVPAESCFFLRHDVTSAGQVKCDTANTVMTVTTPRSEALYALAGMVSSGVMSAYISEFPALIFAAAVDGKNLKESKRILMTHLTNIKGNGSTYSEPELINQYSFGNGQLMRAGKALMSLSLADPSGYKVYEVDGSGRRVSEMKSTVKDGKLMFYLSVSGPNGARMYYEVCKGY